MPTWIARVPADALPENTLASPTDGGLAVHQDHITADLAEVLNNHLAEQVTDEHAHRAGYQLALGHVARGLLDPPRPSEPSAS